MALPSHGLLGSVLVTARGFTYAMAGMPSEAQAVLREMDALSRERFVTS